MLDLRVRRVRIAGKKKKLAEIELSLLLGGPEVHVEIEAGRRLADGRGFW
jgi:hypothetical protein